MLRLVKSILTTTAVLLVLIAQPQQPALAVIDTQNQEKLFSGDWLVSPVMKPAQVYKSADNKDIILYNGLVKRTFRLSPFLNSSSHAGSK